MFEEDLKLPIPVYSYIQPKLQHQFILHLFLSFGRFETELDLVRHPNLRNYFRYAKLIGDNDNEESLKKYSDEIFVCFVEEQLIYFPNSRQQIDEWIPITGDLLDNILIKGCIPITEMPSVQLTTIIKSVDEKCVSVVKKFKSEVISSALKELDGSIVTCNIPTKNRFLEAKKSSPLEWNDFQSLQQSPDQPATSFMEQSFVVKKCTNAIDSYANISRTKLVKNHVIRGYAGCGKSWTMQYCILHACIRGLFALPTAMMANRAVFFGTKHIDWLFGLPFNKILAPIKLLRVQLQH